MNHLPTSTQASDAALPTEGFEATAGASLRGSAGTGPVPSLVLLDGSADLPKAVLGGKAWGVNRMAGMGLPVPPAFCLRATCCEEVNAAGGLTDALRDALREGMAHIEHVTGRAFAGGAGSAPLLVSVRSGAAVSMPGMMDTVLNLGLNDAAGQALAEQSSDPDWVDSISNRFHECFLDVVAPPSGGVPHDPWEQLEAAVLAVFASWESPRAKAYRSHHGITDLAGTAVTVQAMVFGNLDDLSGTGVVFSRNPITGDRAPYGEWLARAQGEDVVSGSTTPHQLSRLAAEQPSVHKELIEIIARLEADAREVQDVEFTVESGRLWVLQTRTAKRSPQAAVRLAVALAEDGLISQQAALGKVSADLVQRSGLTAPDARKEAGHLLAQGEPAGPGWATGLAVGDPDEAADLIDAGHDVVLVRPTTSPDDVHGMFGAVAVVTDLGGSTSHAALVSRELGIACVVGCGAGTADSLAGKQVTVDGSSGRIYEATGLPASGGDGLRSGDPHRQQAPAAAPLEAADDAALLSAEDPAIATLTAWARDAIAACDGKAAGTDAPDLPLPELLERLERLERLGEPRPANDTANPLLDDEETPA